MEAYGYRIYQILLFLILLMSVPSESSAQNTRPVCGTVEYNLWLQSQFPNASESEESFEKWMLEEIALAERNGKRSVNAGVIRTIPLIFHILHDAGQPIGTGANISAEQVQSQVEVLNEDFRRLGNGFNNHPQGADAEIEFCLALVDENDQLLTEPGIMRHSNWGDGPFNKNFVNTIVKPATIQDPEKFLNLWVTPLSTGLLGFAQFPSSSGLADLPGMQGPANQEGVVIIPIAIGNTGSATPPFNTGRIATHEIGHWLGLRHIWGDGDCYADDYCTDTPNCSDPFISTFPSCSNPIQCGAYRMIENYMDYSDGGCMNIFTSQQKGRMNVVLSNSPRRPHSESVPTVCHPYELANIQYHPKTVRSCGPMTISFSNMPELTPQSTQWTFSGVTTSPALSNQSSVSVIVSTTGMLNAMLQASYATAWEEKSVQMSVIILPTNQAICQVPSCTDGVRNGNETGMDCGGSCGACNPNCDQAIVIDGPYNIDENQKAANLIETGNLTGSGDVYINPGQTITLQAQQIVLQSGFSVNPNAGLEIKIGGCE